jgi:hypothetical protein
VLFRTVWIADLPETSEVQGLKGARYATDYAGKSNRRASNSVGFTIPLPIADWRRFGG